MILEKYEIFFTNEKEMKKLKAAVAKHLPVGFDIEIEKTQERRDRSVLKPVGDFKGATVAQRQVNDKPDIPRIPEPYPGKILGRLATGNAGWSFHDYSRKTESKTVRYPIFAKRKRISLRWLCPIS